MAKVRADQLLVDRGLAESRTRAQALILAGLAFIGDRKIDKAGQQVADDAEISVKGRDHPWVSRGGVKLDHALTHLGWDVTDAVAIDVGSSTGGFTDVLLSRGAARVYAVDSRTNQLPGKLRRGARVIVHAPTSARTLPPKPIPAPAHLVLSDASFIALSKVLPVPMGFAKAEARMVALIKPQFEAERQEVGKKGVIRDADVHARVCRQVHDWLEQNGWRVVDTVESPITGPEGNVEFLIAAIKAAA